MRNNSFKILVVQIAVAIGTLGCSQSKWLDEKRILSDVKPENISDFQAILDNVTAMNGRIVCSALAGTDNIAVTDKDFNSINEKERQLYLWQGNPWGTDNQGTSEWSYPFTSIANSNIVLEGLTEQNFSGTESDNIRGQALFFRAYSFYNIMEIYCKQYDPKTAMTEKGLPLRTSSDVSEIFQRASLKETVNQIISDCTKAISLLNETQFYPTRPSGLAARALLAKIYLITGDYKSALEHTDYILNKKPDLLDFNSDKITLSNVYRFPANGVGNEEIIFYAYGYGVGIVRPLTTTRGSVDADFYESYNKDDLRKLYFYLSTSTGLKFRGGYTGGNTNFCGIATNEIYLIKSECEARLGNVAQGLQTLDKLLEKRFRSGTYVAYTSSDEIIALKRILDERRKELPFTMNIRWSDLKRLNKEEDFAKVLIRISRGQEFKLPPNDLRYHLPVPITEIVKSGIEQNSY